ncbi:MAG: bifunctional nicotinamide mononucleotide adenylyltransferase/ADP-ribose pyrophosphatase [Nocardioides sp.]|nr:bifunctional nicotinamide mononucleotide adenylyltransferase/ADP-ribose pyrophosphatase [Nocardioides sp.]
MAPTARTTARVLPVAGDGSCLLLLEQDPARPGEPYWSTVGGAVDPGETPADAAVRELREGTGLDVARSDLVGPVRERTCAYTWGGADYAGTATVFALPLARDTPISFDLLEAEEVGNVLDSRWLTPDEAAADGRLMWHDLSEIMSLAVAAVRTAGGHR